MATRPPRNTSTPASKGAGADPAQAQPPQQHAGLPAAMNTTTLEQRIAMLEHRVAFLESAARTTEQAGGQTAVAPVSVSTPYSYVNGMTVPDEFGRVRLQAVEEERARNGAYYAGKNAPLPEFAFVRAALSTFPSLTQQQINYIHSNTKENAVMRQGRALRVDRGQDGMWHEGEPFENTVSTLAESAEGAAQEILRNWRELASGSPGAVPFGPRAPGG